MGRLVKIICVAVLAVLMVCPAGLYFLPSILKNTLSEVTDSDGKRLAARRAARIGELILKTGAVIADRIFTVQSGGTPPVTK